MPATRLCSRLSPDDFLNFNGPTGVVVAQGDSRTNFFHHLGLREDNFRHRMLYNKMKQEAKAGMQRLFENPLSLDADVVRGKTVTPPYSITQLSEAAFQQEVENIHRTASRLTRGFYDMTQTANGKNWVVRWMLWHVIQAREDQEVRATSSAGETDNSTSSSHSAKEAWSPASDSTVETASTQVTTATSPHDWSDSEDWDDGFQTPTKVKKEPVEQAKTPSTPRKSVFWDHVLT